MIRLALFIALILISQATRFSNTVRLQVSGDSVLVDSHQDHVRLVSSLQEPIRISYSVQQSMSGGARLSQVRWHGAAQDLSFPCLYLFGYCLLGDPPPTVSPSFTSSFGDWTMDRAISNPVPLTELPLRAPFTVEFEFLGRGAKIITLAADSGDPIQVSVNDGFIDNAFSICRGGDCSKNGYSSEHYLTNLARILNWFVEILLLGLTLSMLVRAFGSFGVEAYLASVQIWHPYLLVTLCVVAHLYVATWFSQEIMSSTPHISDSAVYYRQGVLLSEFAIKSAPLPLTPFEAYQSNASKVVDGRLTYGHANHFWPALIGLAIRLGHSDLLTPLLSAITIVPLFFLGQAIFNPATGAMAAVLYSISPFVLVQTGDYMMHIPTLAFFLSGLALLICHKERALLVGVGSALICYAFAMRQLTVIAMLFPLIIYTLVALRSAITSRSFLAAVIGSAIIIALFVFDNRLITGEWFVLPHKHLHGLSPSLNNFSLGANSVDSILGYLPATLFALPLPLLFFGLITLPLTVKPERRALLLFSIFLSLVGAHLFIPVHGLHGYGPRFVFESIFALMILAARGIVLLGSHRSRLLRTLSWSCVALGISYNIISLYRILPLYCGYNQISDNLLGSLRTHKDEKAIFITQGDHWQAMDIAVTLFDPSFTKRIFVNREIDNVAQSLPDFRIYRVEGDTVR